MEIANVRAAPKVSPMGQKLGLGDRMKLARKALRKQQKDVASEAGLPDSRTLWRYETGQSEPGAQALDRIADVLHTTSQWLLHGGPGAPPGIDGAAASSADSGTDLASIATIAALGLRAASDGSDEAVEAFNTAVAEHARQISPRRGRR